MGRVHEKDTNKIPHRELSPSWAECASRRRGLGGGFEEMSIPCLPAERRDLQD